MPILERALADDPGDALRKYRLVFAKGPGMAWDKRDTFNARHGFATTGAKQWAVANLPRRDPTILRTGPHRSAE